jgi:hypothetical protein
MFHASFLPTSYLLISATSQHTAAANENTNSNANHPASLPLLLSWRSEAITQAKQMNASQRHNNLLIALPS